MQSPGTSRPHTVSRAGQKALRLLALVSVLLLSACSADKPPPPPPPPAPIAPQATVLDDQLQSIDRARAVEQTLQEGAERTDAAIEDAESN